MLDAEPDSAATAAPFSPKLYWSGALNVVTIPPLGGTNGALTLAQPDNKRVTAIQGSHTLTKR